MTDKEKGDPTQAGWTRRKFLAALAAGGAGLLCGRALLRHWKAVRMRAEVCIAKASTYGADIAGAIRSALRELGVSNDEIKGRRILLKPNLAETCPGTSHINTHGLVIRGAAEVFRAWGASEVLVAEGTAHCRDTHRLLEESGWAEVLIEDHIRFVDLNYEDVRSIRTLGRRPRLKSLVLPRLLEEVDWVVSMAKMKTHHWAAVTLSMKNLFGVMPGSYYGWPKNVLHCAGIDRTIVDVCATVRPHFAIVDGIVGMEGDGPIMGTPRQAGVLVIGRNCPAVDATCARIMEINPHKVRYLAGADGWLGTIREGNIEQRGETIASVRTRFELIDRIPAHRGIRL